MNIVFLILLLIILFPSDAHAWTAAAAIIGYITGTVVTIAGSSMAVLAATAVLAVGIMGALSFAMSAIAGLFAASPQEQKAASSRGQLINSCDTQMPLPVVYGRQRIGINRVYSGVSGYDNKYLHIVGTLCEGEIEGIVEIDGVPQIFLNDRLYNTIGTTPLGNPLFTYEFFNGSPTQDVCADLHAAIPEWTDPLRNTAYIYCVFTFNTDKFQGLPEITVVVDGLKIKNLDTEVVEYSNNPAYCGFDLMTRRSVRGGMEIAEARIDIDQVNECAAYCDVKGWTTNLVLLQNTAVADNLMQVLAPFRGDVYYSATQFKMRYTDLNYEASVADINENDIIETSGQSTLQIAQPDIFDTPNAVRMKFINSEKLYQMDDYVLADSAAIEADGDYRESEIYMRGVTSLPMVMKHANYLLERARYNKTISFIMGSKGLAFEPFDIFRLTNAVYGLDAKLFRVTEVTRTQIGLAAINAVEETASMYDDVYDLSPSLFYTTTLPSILDDVVSVRNVALTEEVYFYRERSYTRLKVTFDPPLAEVYPQWSYADVYVKIADGDWKFMTKAVSSYNIDPVEEGVRYEIGLVSVSSFGSKQQFTDGYFISKTILGVTGVPGDVTGLTAIAAGDCVTLFANALDEPDIAGYEVRLGDAWQGSAIVGFNETPNFRFVGIKPSPFEGYHKFWIAARNNNNIYSENPVSTTAIVFYPPGYVDKNTWSWDFDGIGTFYNLEHILYEGTEHSLKRTSGGYLLNNGFETWSDGQTATGWYGGATLYREATIIKSGTYSARVTRAGANTWVVQDIQNAGGRNLAYWKGKTVTLGMWVYATVANRARITLWDGAAGTSAQHSGVTGWEFLTTTHTITSGATMVIASFGVYNGDTSAYFDDAVMVEGSEISPSGVLTGTWTSPEYDLGSVKNVRVWGDFRTALVGSGGTWSALFPGTWTEGGVVAGKRWHDILTPSVAGSITARLLWGIVTGELNDSITKFEFMSPEITARYVKVEVTVTDPNLDVNLILKELHMTAAFWQ